MEAVTKAKPTGAKGQFIRKVVLTSTMGPGVKVDTLQAEQLGLRKAAVAAQKCIFSSARDSRHATSV